MAHVTTTTRVGRQWPLGQGSVSKLSPTHSLLHAVPFSFPTVLAQPHGRSPVLRHDRRLSGVQQLLPVALSLQVNDLRFATPPREPELGGSSDPSPPFALHPPSPYSKEEAKYFLTLSSWMNSTPQSPGRSSTLQPSPPCSTSHQPSRSSVGTRQPHPGHPLPAKGVAGPALAPIVGVWGVGRGAQGLNGVGWAGDGAGRTGGTSYPSPDSPSFLGGSSTGRV